MAVHLVVANFKLRFIGSTFCWLTGPQVRWRRRLRTMRWRSRIEHLFLVYLFFLKKIPFCFGGTGMNARNNWTNVTNVLYFCVEHRSSLTVCTRIVASWLSPNVNTKQRCRHHNSHAPNIFIRSSRRNAMQHFHCDRMQHTTCYASHWNVEKKKRKVAAAAATPPPLPSSQKKKTLKFSFVRSLCVCGWIYVYADSTTRSFFFFFTRSDIDDGMVGGALTTGNANKYMQRPEEGMRERQRLKIKIVERSEVTSKLTFTQVMGVCVWVWHRLYVSVCGWHVIRCCH